MVLVDRELIIIKEDGCFMADPLFQKWFSREFCPPLKIIKWNKKNWFLLVQSSYALIIQKCVTQICIIRFLSLSLHLKT